MLVVVNPHAGAGKGLARWERVKAAVHERIGSFTSILPGAATEARQAIRNALRDGERDFVAAGGDGTVNLVVATLLDDATADQRERLRLGAIGLGSSNDFHKPHRPGARIGTVPVRLAFDHVEAHDVGRMRYRTGADEWRCRRWILNASIGVTAEGNRRYNDDPAVGRAKRILPDLGMAWAAVGALRAGGPRPMSLSLDGAAPVLVRVTNLGVVKNPHFTGILRYDTPYEPASGRFDVHVLGDVSPARRVRAFVALCRGRFTGLRGTTSWQACWLRVAAEGPFAVEGDGEVLVTTDVEFSLDARVLAVCT